MIMQFWQIFAQIFVFAKSLAKILVLKVVTSEKIGGSGAVVGKSRPST